LCDSLGFPLCMFAPLNILYFVYLYSVLCIPWSLPPKK
jgi:hypothetical protein